MMYATEILRREHADIDELLGHLLKTLESGEPRRNAVGDLLDSLRELWVEVHGPKESEHVGWFLENQGLVGAQRAFELLAGRHAAGTSMLDELCRLASGINRVENFERFAALARRYAVEIREQLEWEEYVLLPLLEVLLTRADQRQLAESFDRLDRERVEETVIRRISVSLPAAHMAH